MKLTEASIERPVLAWMIMAALIVFGAVALRDIGISQFPDVDFPTISVYAEFEGAAPEIMENDVVEPLEEELIQIEGIRSLTSVARQGSASVTVELDLARDVDLALQDVQAKVYQARNDLPRDMEPPTISKSNPEDNPIMWLGLSGPFPQQVLADYVRYRIKERLQTIPGVGEIVMGGYLERNVRIWIDASALDQRGLVVGDVLSALRREHLAPDGHLGDAVRAHLPRAVDCRDGAEEREFSSIRARDLRQVGRALGHGLPGGSGQLVADGDRPGF